MPKIGFEPLHTLCIANHWFTCGTNHQYTKLFELAENGGSIDELAAIIWACSEDATGTLDQIKAALKAHERRE